MIRVCGDGRAVRAKFERILAEDEVVEREVFLDTTIHLKYRRSGLKHCTLGARCLVIQPDEIFDEADKPFVENCLFLGDVPDLAGLWEEAARCDDAGHLAAGD